MRHDYYRRIKPTERELQVLAHTLMYGRKVAADNLDISERTATHHLTSLYGRVGAENRCTAAIAVGWLDIPSQYGIYIPLQTHASVIAESLAEAVVHYVEAVLAERLSIPDAERLVLDMRPDLPTQSHGFAAVPETSGRTY